MNETTDLSKAEELMNILKKDERRLATGYRSRGRGAQDGKSRDTINLTDNESFYASRKGAVDDEYRSYISPFKLSRQRESPNVRVGSRLSTPENEGRFEDRPLGRDKEKEVSGLNRKYSMPSMPTEKSQVIERYDPNNKVKEVGQAANKLMEILNLDSKEGEAEDKKVRPMDIIGEEESGASKTELHYTAKFSKDPTAQSISVEKGEIKTLEGYEIPLEEENKGDKTDDDDDPISYEAFLKRHRNRIMERSKTPEVIV